MSRSARYSDNISPFSSVEITRSEFSFTSAGFKNSHASSRVSFIDSFVSIYARFSSCFGISGFLGLFSRVSNSFFSSFFFSGLTYTEDLSALSIFFGSTAFLWFYIGSSWVSTLWIRSFVGSLVTIFSLSITSFSFPSSSHFSLIFLLRPLIVLKTSSFHC